MILGNRFIKKKLTLALRSKKFVGESNTGLNTLTFQLSNIRELETIKYAYAYYPCKEMSVLESNRARAYNN